MPPFSMPICESKGAEPVNFDEFQHSTEAQRRVIRHRSASPTSCISTSIPAGTFAIVARTNPDFGATFPQALKLDNVTAIPRNDNDFNGALNSNFPGNDHIQAIANVAGFHFGYIEQGGSSLYAALGQKVSSLEVLKITQGIGGDEIAHFLEWVDFVGQWSATACGAVYGPHIRTVVSRFFQQPTAATAQPGSAQPDLSRFPANSLARICHTVSVIRPIDDKFGGAVATIASFTADGLFVGQTPKFFQAVNELAEEADAATTRVLIS